MALVALAFVLSLVAALAPDASAQDGGAAPEGAARWMQYNLPTGDQLDIATGVNPPPLVLPKNCCITIQYGCQPTPPPTSGENPAPVSATGTATPYQVQPRWFCMGTAQ